MGLFQGGVVLHPGRFRKRRLVWNALRPLTLDTPRGFMYSRRHLEALWSTREEPSEVSEYVSHYQLLPPMEMVREPITYYIDATMRQFFDDYDWRLLASAFEPRHWHVRRRPILEHVLSWPCRLVCRGCR